MELSNQLKDYIKIDDAARKWEISVRRVQALCAGGRIPGVLRVGRDWMIPAAAPRPTDGRTKQGRQALARLNAYQPLPRKTPFLHMTDLYSVPGSANEAIQKLSYHPEAKLLFEAEISYSRGQIDRVYQYANDLLSRHSGFYAILSAGILLAQCAIWRGDLAMWRRAKLHIAEAPAKTDNDRDIVSLCITAADSMLYDVTAFPEWFRIGCFEPLPPESLPAAKVYYAKYLFADAYAVATKQLEIPGFQGLSLMWVIPFVLEPMISQAIADNSIISEFYLRMSCATAYNTCGNQEQAIRHIDQAIALALPDRLYGLLAEYCRVIGPLLENRLQTIDPEVCAEVRHLFKIYNLGWSKLSGSVRGKNLITTLSQKEREVATLAAFGMQNSEIAEKLHMSLSGVKQAIRIVSEKSGVNRDEFAAIL